MRRGWVPVAGVAVLMAALGYVAGTRVHDQSIADAPAARLQVAAWLQDWRPEDSPGTTTLDVAADGEGTACARREPCALRTAQDHVRALAPTMAADIVVSLQDGSYVLDEPVVFGAADSGRNGHRVVYRAAEGATPQLAGGLTIGDWRADDGAPGMFIADVPIGTTGRQLFVNGTRATRARGADRPAGWAKTAKGFRAPDVHMATWARPADIEIVSFAEWRAFRCHVASIEGREITMSEPCWRNAIAPDRFPMQDVTWVENAIELLDDPGEWYLDTAAGRLHYRPRAGEDLATATVVLAVRDSLLEVRGTPDQPVHDLGVEGLTFAFAGWQGPSTVDGYASAQAGWHRLADAGPEPLDIERTPGAVRVSHAHHVRLAGNTFEHLGGVGLDVLAGSQDLGVVGNRFRDISSSAVQIGEGRQGAQNAEPRDQLDRLHVANNLVDHAAVEYVDGVGIFVSYASNVSILHNELTHLPYSGISLGWGWNTDSYARNNLVFANRITDVMTTLNDGGAIYTLSPMPGTVIERNHITDQHRRGGALFLDEGTAFVTVADNVIERTPRWLHIWTSSIRDNTIVDNASDSDAMLDDGRRNVVARNHTNRSDWPATAYVIIDEAGLEPAFRPLRDQP